MKRVMVLGGPGAGKTALALRLGEITGLPVFHADHICGRSGRKMGGEDERIGLANGIEARERWIVEGGLCATYGNLAARADTAIWLDLPLGRRLGRVLTRGRSGRRGPGVLFQMLRSRQGAREEIARALAGAPHLEVHHIRTARGADTLLEWIGLEQDNH